jgi:voltage-gated potassium channel
LEKQKTTHKNWRAKLHEVIYEADTTSGKVFDVLLLILILVSIIAVMLESIEVIDNKYHDALNAVEWVVTILFSLEYIARIISVKKPSQ